LSNAVFPTLIGARFPVSKQPMWSGKVQQAASGAETRVSYWSYPRWRYTIGYEVLRDAAATQDLQALVGFYNSRHGQFDDFLFSDPDDNAVTAQAFGIGDGTTTTFQLTRSLGGFAEPVLAPIGSPVISLSDWQGTRTLTSTTRGNLITYSEQFGNAAWVKSSATVTDNFTAAPDGATTADKIDLSASTTAYVLNTASATVAASTNYCFSVWLRGTPGQTVYLQLACDTGIAGAFVTLTASFARYYVAGATGGAPTGNPKGFIQRNTTGTATILYAWGAQIEIGLTPTAYIKTVAAPVSGPDYTLSTAGLVTLTSAPSATAALSWTGSYYWRVRFDDMDFTLEKMMQGYWSSGDIMFTSVK
jgi:uncharacterized protein (TIGR02217 family)